MNETRPAKGVSWKTDFTQAEKHEIASKRTLPRLLSVPCGALGMYALGEGTFGTHPAVIVALTAFTCTMLFCWTSAFHEAAHQTLWRSQTFSILCGRILGTLLWVPYTVYRQVHIRHHAFLNRPDDWELWPYSSPATSLRFRKVFAWVDLFCGIVTGPFIYGRLFFHPQSPLRDKPTRRAIAFEYLLIVMVWGSIWSYTTAAGIWPNHIRGIIIPMWIAGMLQTGRKFTEHLGMNSFDPIQGTRTVLPSQWLLRLSSFLNFDIFIHGPHHRYPRAAHTTLRTRLEEYRTAHIAEPQVYQRYHHAILAMLPWLMRNPGCGLNVQPSTGVSHTIGEEVADFDPDVAATETVSAPDCQTHQVLG